VRFVSAFGIGSDGRRDLTLANRPGGGHLRLWKFSFSASRLHLLRGLRHRLGRFALGSDDQIFETARVRSIKAHATRITPPSELEDEAKILMGIAGVDHDHPADHHH